MTIHPTAIIEDDVEIGPDCEIGAYAVILGAELNGELTRVLNAPDMKERFAKQGTEVRTGTAESLT